MRLLDSLVIKPGCCHFFFNFEHKVFDTLQTSLFFRRYVLYNKRLQAVNVDVDAAAEESDDSSEGYHNDNYNAEDNSEESLSQPFIGQYGDRNLLECRRNRCTHYRPPALPNRAAL